MKRGFVQQLQAEGFPLAKAAAPVVRQKGPTVGNSELAIKLLEQWCWGAISLPTLQVLAEAAVQDGVHDPLMRLQGFFGTWRGNWKSCVGFAGQFRLGSLFLWCVWVLVWGEMFGGYLVGFLPQATCSTGILWTTCQPSFQGSDEESKGQKQPKYLEGLWAYVPKRGRHFWIFQENLTSNAAQKLLRMWLGNLPGRIFKPSSLTALSSTITVQMVHSKLPSLTKWRQVTNAVIWPHELFAWIYENHKQGFLHSILGGSEENVKIFWRNMPSRPGLETKHGWREKCIPIAIHGDGVAVSNVRGKASKQADCISWTSLLGKGKTSLTTFLVWFCFRHLAKKGGFQCTWPQFWSRLCRSLQILFSGIWPSKTMNGEDEPRAGQELAGGFFALVYINRGDLDWVSGHFKLNHPSSNYPCCLCQCSNLPGAEERPWTDCNSKPLCGNHLARQMRLGWKTTPPTASRRAAVQKSMSLRAETPRNEEVPPVTLAQKK